MKQLTARFTLFFILLIKTLVPQANDMGVSYSGDSNSTQSSLFDLGFDVGKQTQLYVGGGESVIKDSSGEITTTSYNMGLNGVASEQLDYDIGFSYWGNTNELTTKTLSVGVSLNTEDWTFTLRPELQKIVLYTKNARRQININSAGLYASVDYFGFDSVELFYAHSRYRYNRNLAALNTRLADLFFSNTSLMLSGSFLDKRDQAEVAFTPDYSWLPKRIAVSYSRSLIAVDKSHSETFSLNLRFNLSKTLELELEGGQVRPEFSPQLNYGLVSLHYRH